MVKFSEVFSGDIPQHMIACLPLASMAQKKESSPPKAAEMGPMDPNPYAEMAKERKRKNTEERDSIASLDFWGAFWVCLLWPFWVVLWG